MNYYFDLLTDYFAAHPVIALAIVFLIAMGEALFIVGLVVPSTVVLVSAGTLVGMGKLDFTPVLIATILGAIAGDAISYWVGRKWEQQVRRIWPFSRYTFLMDKGEAFFAKHGGKSVFIGRFIPGIKAVVPGIAGIMGMGAWHFTVVNVVSAVVWSLAHLLPGVVVGRGLDVAQTSNPRVLVLLVILSVTAVLTWYSFKIGARMILPYVWKLRRNIAARLALNKSWAGKWSARILMNRGFVVTSQTYIILAAVFSLSFLVLTLFLSYGPDVINFDKSLIAYLASLKTQALNPVLMVISLAGSVSVLIAVGLTLICTLIVVGRWKLGLLALVSFLVSHFVVILIENMLGRLRPVTTFQVSVETFSFPSHQTTMSLVVYGLCASLIAWNLGAYFRRYVFMFFFLLVALIGFSTLYFAYNWPSDIIAAGLVGGAIIFTLLHIATKNRDLNPNIHKLNPVLISSVVCIALTASLTFQVTQNLDAKLAEVKPASPINHLSVADWRAGVWLDLPVARKLFDGKTAEPIQIQTNIELVEISKKLMQAGWHKSKSGVITTLTDSIVPAKSSIDQRSVLPLTNAGTPPKIVFEKMLDAHTKAVARVWHTSFTADGTEISAISVMREKLKEIPFGFSFVERTAFDGNTKSELLEDIVQVVDGQIERLSLNNVPYWLVAK
ncbi:MAG: bifunctional DedA family/phosphatase PAP2 family protein [Alphaproteobacteria bacterium]